MDEIPVIKIKSQSLNIVSDKTGYRQCVCTFTVNSDIIQWEARAVKGKVEPQRGVGTLVESGQYLKENEIGTVYVDYNELVDGDGNYTISIFAQSIDGFWSDGSYVETYIGFSYNSQINYNSNHKYNCNELLGEKYE